MTEIGRHPQRLDLTVHPGDPITANITVYDTTGAAITSLAGYSCAARAYDTNDTILWDFAPTIVSNQIRVTATSAQTGGWTWQPYAVRLVVTATPPAGAAQPVALGWIRFYKH